MVNLIAKLLKWLPWVGLALLLAAFVMVIKDKQFNELTATLALSGVALFLLIFVRGESANVKFYINVAVASILTLGILVIIYLFVGSRKDWSWDLTKQQSNSLAPKTQEVLKDLKAPVTILAFFPDGPAEMVKDYLERYSTLSKNVKVEMLNPTRDNLKIKQYNDQFGTEINPMDIIVYNTSEPKKEEQSATAPAEGEKKLEAKAKPRYKRVMLPQRQGANPLDNAEAPLINAIVEVSQEKEVRVYALQGPGYKSLGYEAMAKNRSLSQFKTALNDQAIKIEPLEMRGQIPSDCSILMAAGIQTDLFPAEVDIISKYLDKGGKLLVFFDPPGKDNPKLDNWANLLAKYGVRPTNSYVMDYVGQAYAGNPTVFITNQFDKSHPITKELTQQQMMVQGVRYLEKIDPAPSGYTVTELVKSSPKAWTMKYEDLLRSNGRVVMPKPEELKELPLAVAVGKSGDESGTKLVVFGNGDMISDAGIENTSFTLATFSINWLGGNEELLHIPPRQMDDTPLLLKDEQRQMVWVLEVLALPALLFFGGLTYTMLRRRSR